MAARRGRSAPSSRGRPTSASAATASSESAAAAYLGGVKRRPASSDNSRSYSVQADRAKTLTRGSRLSSSTVRERLAEAPHFPGSALLGDIGGIIDPADVLLGSEIAQRFRPCFEAMLPPCICPAELREAVWRLTHWVLARSDAGRLEGGSLVELMVARKTPLPCALARDEGDAAAKAAGGGDGGAVVDPEELAAEASAMKGLGERGGLGEWLLNPAAVGAMAHLAFDAAAEHVETREFFHALHALLSGVITLGAGRLLAALREDATTSCLLLRWDLPCPAPYGPGNLGGVVGLLRLRGAALMVTLAKLPRGAQMPVPIALGMRRWARLAVAARRKADEGSECGPEQELVPRPFFILVRRWVATGSSSRAAVVDKEEEAAAAPFASWGATSGGEMASVLHTEILQIVSGSPQRWRTMRLLESVGEGAVHGYTMEPALRECTHCRVEVIECAVPKVAGNGGPGGPAYGAGSRGNHHRSVDALAVCRLAPEAPGGPVREYHFVFPHVIGLRWATQGAAAVRSTELVPVLCARSPANHFLFEPNAGKAAGGTTSGRLPGDIHVATQPAWAAVRKTYSRLGVEGGGQPRWVAEILTPMVTVVAPALSKQEVEKMVALRESFAREHGLNTSLQQLGAPGALDERSNLSGRRDRKGPSSRRTDPDRNGVRSRRQVELDSMLGVQRDARVAGIADSLDSLGVEMAVLEEVEAGGAPTEALGLAQAMRSMAVIHFVVTQPQPMMHDVTGEVQVETKSGTGNAGEHFVACHARVPFSLSASKPQVKLSVEVEILHAKRRQPGDDECFYVELSRVVTDIGTGSSANGQVDRTKKSATVVVLDSSSAVVTRADPVTLLRARNTRASSGSSKRASDGKRGKVRATTKLIDVWKPITATQSCCLRCGQTGFKHTNGVVWPQCLALHGPPATFATLPRVDMLMLTLADQRRHQASALIRVQGLPGSDAHVRSPGASKRISNRGGGGGVSSDSDSADEGLDELRDWPKGLENWAEDAQEADDDLDDIDVDPSVTAAFGNAFTKALMDQKMQMDDRKAKDADEEEARRQRPASAASKGGDVSDALALLAGVSFLPEERKKQTPSVRRAQSAAPTRSPGSTTAGGSGQYDFRQRQRSAPVGGQRLPEAAGARKPDWNDDSMLPGRRARSASVNRAKFDRRSLTHMASDAGLVSDAIAASPELQEMLKAAPGLRKLIKDPEALAAVMKAKEGGGAGGSNQGGAWQQGGKRRPASAPMVGVSIADLPAAVQVSHTTGTKSGLAERAGVDLGSNSGRQELSRRQKSFRAGSAPGGRRQSRKESEFAAVSAASGAVGAGPRGLVKLAEAVDRAGQVDAYGADGRTPLIAAAQNGNLEGMLLLLSRGANPLKAAKVGGETPLMVAAERGHADIVATILEAIEAADETGDQAEEAINKANTREGRGRTAMVLALEGGHAAVAELLAASGGAVPSQMSGKALIMAEKHGLQALLATTATRQAQRRAKVSGPGEDDDSDLDAQDGATQVGGGAEDAEADAWTDAVAGVAGGSAAAGHSCGMGTVDRRSASARAAAAAEKAAADEKSAARAEAVRSMAFAGLEAGQEEEDTRFLEELERWQANFWTAK